MKTWHGYPIPDDADPDRPWWRRVGASGIGIYYFDLAYVRADGKTIWYKRDRGYRGDDSPCFSRPVGAMACVDTEEPMERPPVLVGQVWAAMVGQVDGPDRMGFTLVDDPSFEPYSHAVLVWGPFAPWGPA